MIGWFPVLLLQDVYTILYGLSLTQCGYLFLNLNVFLWVSETWSSWSLCINYISSFQKFTINCINCSSSRNQINSKFHVVFLLAKQQFCPEFTCCVCLTDLFVSCQIAILRLISWVNLLVILWVDKKCKPYLNYNLSTLSSLKKKD